MAGRSIGRPEAFPMMPLFGWIGRSLPNVIQRGEHCLRQRRHKRLRAARSDLYARINPFGWLPWIALLATIIGARLWLISLFATGLPIHDQWDAKRRFFQTLARKSSDVGGLVSSP